MAAVIDQDVRLDEKRVRRQDNDYRSKSYPFQIPVYHCLAMHIYQPPGDIFELSRVISSATDGLSVGIKPYKLEPIHIPMHLDELINVPIDHPFRHHCELVIAHRHSQQWQHVLMVKGFPRHNLPAEPLQRMVNVS